MKKIALLHWPISSVNDEIPQGGIEVMELAQRDLLATTFDVSIISPGSPESSRKGLQYISASNKFGVYNLWYYFQYYLRYSNLYDVVLSYNGALLALFQTKNTFLYFHNLMNFKGKHKPVFLPFYSIFRTRYHAAQIILVSEFLKRIFISRYPEFPIKNVHVLENFVEDPSNFLNLEQGDNNCKSNKKKILFVGQWNRAKGLHLLIESILRLKQYRHDFELHLIGGASLWNQANGSQVDIPDIPEIVQVGRMPHSAVLRYMSQMDILVVPSVWEEPFGLVAIEGLAVGVLTIVSNRGAFPDIIQNNSDGLVFEGGNVNSLEEAIVAALDMDLNLQKAIKIAGLRKYHNRFTEKVHIKKLVDIINGF